MADKVVAKYVADVKEYIKEIERATGIAQKEFEKTNTTASGLEGGLKKIGGAVAAAFAVDRIVGFTKEASKLAAQGEGIRKAFERVGDPTLLDGLKQATRGTVTELELMKGAIRASNFKIPLDQLAQLFEFARRRAKETGESVDYLVNSIVMGIGRKSPLILDNLGISAIELRKRFDGISIATANVADVARIVGEIATEEMQKMGTEALTTADRIKQLETAVGDLSEQYGKAVNESLLFYADLFGVIDLENMEAAKLQAEIAQRDFVDFQRDIKSGYLDLDGAIEKSIKMREALIVKEKQVANWQYRLSYVFYPHVKKALEEKIKVEQFSIGTDEKRLALIDDYIDALEAAAASDKDRIKNVAYYSALLKSLQGEQSEENTTLARNAELIDLIAAAQENLNRLKGKGKGEKPLPEVGELMPVTPKGITELDGMGNSLSGLNDLLKEQQEILQNAPEFSQEYTAAATAIDDLNDRIDNFGNKIQTVNVDMVDLMDDTATVTAKTWEQSFDTATNIAETFYDANRRAEDLQIQHQEQLLKSQLENQTITQEEYSEKLKAIQRQRAENAKGDAMFHAILNTAQSVTSALAAYDYVSAVLFGVLGAAEIATIAAQPIPQFAQGTKDAPSGFKWVGEEGPELIYDGGGYPIITHKESMKILEKYNIETVDFDSIQKGGFGALGESAKLQGFNDRNLLVAIDRHRVADRTGFEMMAKEFAKAMKGKRRGYA